jgi:hypothetical protein
VRPTACSRPARSTVSRSATARSTPSPTTSRPNILRLVKLDLREVSIVTFAANERARVDSVKHILAAGELPTVREFEGALRELGLSKAKAAAIAAAATPHLRGEPEAKASEDMRRFYEALRA